MQPIGITSNEALVCAAAIRAALTTDNPGWTSTRRQTAETLMNQLEKAAKNE